jgi:protein-disulfide isomerase/uncharacterized membrane protein
MEANNNCANQAPTRLCAAFIATLVLCAVGLFASFESTVVFLKTRVDPSYKSSCNVNEKINCETVERSRWAVVPFVTGDTVEASTDQVVGRLPTAMLALVGYSFLTFISLAGLWLRRQRRERGVLFLFGAVFLAFSVLLLVVMHFVIGSWCTLCLTADLVNLGIFALAVLAVKSEGQSLWVGAWGAVKEDLQWIFGRPTVLLAHAALGFGLLGAAWGANTLWITPPLTRAAMVDREAEQLFSTKTPDPQAAWADDAVPAGVCGPDCHCGDKAPEEKAFTPDFITMGKNAEGHHWIGAATASLTIDEFTDYECPHCRKAHMRLRRLLAKYPGQLRIVHRHFPLDQACNSMIKSPFHERACQLSFAAFCAGQQGRFWEMNDALFQNAKDLASGTKDAMSLAESLQLDMDAFECCLAGPEAAAAVAADVAAGLALKVQGTPAFVVDGKLYLGSIPESVLASLKAPN